VSVRGWVGATLIAVFVATGSVATADTPAQLFAADASGLLKVTARCPLTKGTIQGSGFLLGPRLMITARHVLVDPQDGKACEATVVQEGTGTHARVVRWMAISTAATKAPTDLAIAVLSARLTGHYFSISTAAPRPHDRVVILGYALGQPLSLNQGHVSKLTTRNHVRLIQMVVLEAGGASGGPILDVRGDVIGVDQFGGGGVAQSVDLARLVHDDPRQLCFGVASAQTATICGGGVRRPRVLGEDVAPPTCLGVTIDLPFQDPCPPGAEDVTGVVEVTAHCAKEWDGSGFLLGPRVVMMSRLQVTDGVTGDACPATIVEHGDTKTVTAKVTKWTPIRVAGSLASTDVVIGRLDTPVAGHYFGISATSPTPGAAVHALSFAFGFPSTFNEGRVLGHVTMNGVYLLRMRLKGVAPGSGGGPIVDEKNDIVGLVQWQPSAAITLSVDLPALSGGTPSRLCVGVAGGAPSTVCRAGARPQKPWFAGDVPPLVCDGGAEIPPFTTCPGMLGDCWLTDSPASGQQVKQVIEGDFANLFLIQQFSSAPAPGTKLALQVNDPAGRIARIGTADLSNQGTMALVVDMGLQLGLTSPTPGTWRFSVAVSDGSHCESSVDVTPS
jgi:hypothetical protein